MIDKYVATMDCTGCTACAAICPQECIAMTADHYGFLYPAVDAEKCVECGLCEAACPLLHPMNMLGENPVAFAAYSKDEPLRQDSSSGGVFSELANTVLEDGGAVFGAAYNEKFEVTHICVEDHRDLKKLRSAKYAQSDLQGVFLQVKSCLGKGQRVLFCGTPCQVAGLKTYLGAAYENLVTVDFVCHSIPSPMAWKEYVKFRSLQDNSGELPKYINLRSKETGWSRYQYANLFEYKDGTTHTVKSGQSLYMKLFIGGYISRMSCADCRFKGYNRNSDLTLGDFWGIWDVAPDMDDNKGTSLVLVHSRCGMELVERVSQRLVMREVSLDQTSKQNSAMLESYKAHPNREKMLSAIAEGNIADCVDWVDRAGMNLSLRERIARRLFGRK